MKKSPGAHDGAERHASKWRWNRSGRWVLPTGLFRQRGLDKERPVTYTSLNFAESSNRRNNGEEAAYFMQRLFLKLGDQVIHLRYPQWGIGVVVEQRSSTVAGGMCIARVVFRDGVERSFFNDLENSNCCYYTGIRLQEDSESIHR